MDTFSGKGDGIVKDDRFTLYHVQIRYGPPGTYAAYSERDKAYGNELKFMPIVGSEQLGYRQIPRDSTIYIVYRGKGSHITGHQNEKSPTTELLLKIPSGESLESIVMFGDASIGQCGQVSNAEFGFTLKASAERQVKIFAEEFKMVVEQCSPGLRGRVTDTRSSTWSGTSRADFFVSGPINDVLRMYSFLPNALERIENIDYEKVAMSFS